MLRVGGGWRDLPAPFGRWQSVYSCFRAWVHNGLWQAIHAQLSSQLKDDEYLMIDSTAVRVHAHGSGPAGGQLAQAIGRSRASLSTKIHMAADALGYPLGFILTGADVADYNQAPALLKRHLITGATAIMDKGYDGDSIRLLVEQKLSVAAIALNSRRSLKPAFDQHLYKERHRIENLFAKLKAFRRIATRYEKLCLHYSAMVSIASILIWLQR